MKRRRFVHHLDINFKSMYIEIQAVDKTLLVSMPEAFFLLKGDKIFCMFIVLIVNKWEVI